MSQSITDALNFITANLTAFGLTDMKVSVKEDGEWIDGVSLIEICAGGHEGRFKDHGKFSVSVYTNCERKLIGWVDSDNQFNFSDAPDLRTCIAWAVATDLGRKELLNSFNLEESMKKLESIFKEEDYIEAPDWLLYGEFFSGSYAETIQEVMKYKVASRFADGYCGVQNLFWKVATRTICGREHQGFPFAY